jgi:hypothetical protein
VKKLILFDIDGTLLWTQGAAKRAFQRAREEVYGTAGPIPNTVTVSASTYDPVAGNNSSTIQTPVNTDLIFKDGFQ